MTREQMIREVGEQMKLEIARNPGLECCEDPNQALGIIVRGRIDLMALAEWVFKRMG